MDNNNTDAGSKLVIATLYELKPRFQQLLRPLTAWFARRGVTANQVTVAAALGSVALGIVLLAVQSSRVFLLLPLFLFLRMALNAIDGMLAREHGQASKIGAILNELGDVVSDSALYLPFALLPGASAWLMVVVVLLAALSEMAGVLGLTLGASRRYDGPMGKSDRALVFGLLALLVGVNVPLAAYLDWVFGLVAVLLILTCIRRARRALAEVGA